MSIKLHLQRSTIYRVLRKKLSIQRRIFWHQQMHGETFSFIHINKCGGTSIEKVLKLPKIHDTALQRRAVIGTEKWNQRFSFSVVRHPFSRVVSLYNYRIKTKNLTADMHPPPPSLNEWVVAAFGNRDPRYIDDSIMFAPCRTWLTDQEDRIIVDRAVKLEELNEEWPTIVQRLGRQGLLLPHSNKTESTSIDGAFEALDDRSQNVLRDWFKSDLETFYS